MILNGWKEIAEYLGRGIRTVQRWEDRGLPVRHPTGSSRGAVIAMSEDVDRWVRRHRAQAHDPAESERILLANLELLSAKHRQLVLEQMELTKRLKQHRKELHAKIAPGGNHRPRD